MLATVLKRPRLCPVPEPARSEFGAELHAIREEKRQSARLSDSGRYSLRGLGERAGVSASAIGQLEVGRDPRTGKEIRPRLDTVRMLARALADDEDDYKVVYERLMRAAGYFVGGTENAAPTRAQTTIQVIVRLNPGTEGLSDDDKAFLERLAERSQIILDGGEDPGP